MPTAAVLYTARLSATSGTRDLASIIASSVGGAGSPRRIYNFDAKLAKNKGLSPVDYFFTNFGGNKKYTPQFNSFYQSFSRYP